MNITRWGLPFASVIRHSCLVMAFAASAYAEPLAVPEPPPVVIEGGPQTVSEELIPGATAELVVPPYPIRIVHPPEGARLPSLRSSFVFGSANPNGQLTINGQPVSIHPGGGFLTMLNYSPGDFTIRAELRIGTATATLTRRIVVSEPTPLPPPSPPEIVSVEPSVDMGVMSGDRVTVSCVGSPGNNAYFQVQGIKGKFPMIETGRGTYRGVFISLGRDDLEKAEIKVTLTDEKGDKATKEAAGRLTSLWSRPPWVVEVSTDNAVLRSGPSFGPGDKAGYVLFPPIGVRLLITGRQGSELRARLSPSRSAWISESDVKPLPEGTSPPLAAAGTVSMESRERSALVRIGMDRKVPFEVVPAPDGETVDVSFFGAVSNTDWMHYPSTPGIISSLRWFQDETDVYRVRVHAKPGSWWGYDARYEGGFFVLELRRPPPLANPHFPLEGLTIVVDPGHASDRGSIGPTGFIEKDANLLVAQCLKKKLLEAKAQVVMIREADDHVYLYDRPKLAWLAKGDILISVHNNALPEGGNPFEKNGYSVYYFHPQSFELAREIHESYGNLLGRPTHLRRALRDDGLHYGNLALARTPQMPAVLTESAYMILPDEEAFLKTEKFQCECAEAMLRGLKDYARDMREPLSPAGSPANKKR
jgi:N-acetylmuramoyl-L-alanine amidase